MNTGTGGVGRRLDGSRWRGVHTHIAVALGIGWMLDAFEVTIVGNILGVLKELWNVTATQASLLVSVWLIGIMIGAALFGYFADRYGRRKLFIATLLLYSAFTVISALSPGYYWFLAFRFLTALGVGAEYSAVNAAISELIPARYRGRASAIVMNFWPLGAILASLITLYFINLMPAAVGWRVAFALGAVIALFTLWARRVLPESPRWLAGKGRVREAWAVSRRMATEAGAFSAGSTARSSSKSRSERFVRQVGFLAREYPGRLALGSALDFFEAFGYYGLFVMLPLVVLPQLDLATSATAWFFIIGNVGAVVGGLLAAYGLDSLGRKWTVTGFYLLAALSMVGMGLATASATTIGVLAAFTVANFCATGSWVAAYPTFSELLPTGMRASGIGFSVAVGRIGAAIAPPLLVMVAMQVSVAAAFAIMVSSYALGGLCMFLWSLKGPEARARPLESLVNESPSGI